MYTPSPLPLDWSFFLLASPVNTSLSALILPEIGLNYCSPMEPFFCVIYFFLRGGALKIILFIVCFCHFNSTSTGRGDKCVWLFPHIDPLTNQALHLTPSAIALPRPLSLITSSSFRSHDLALHDPLSWLNCSLFFLVQRIFLDILQNRSENHCLMLKTTDFHVVNYNPGIERLPPSFPFREMKVLEQIAVCWGWGPGVWEGKRKTGP